MDTIKEEPLFSIVIPAKNAERTIEKAVKSVMQQTFKNYKCFVVDDNSNDQTITLVSSLVLGKENFKLLTVPKGKWGPGAARNVALNEAKGRYILFLDADDELASDDVLDKISKRLEEGDYPEALLLGFTRYWRTGSGKILLKTNVVPNKKQLDKHYQIGLNNEGTIWSVAWKRELFLKNAITFPENTIWEDLIPKLELFNSARTIELFEACTHIYNVRPKISIGTSPNMKKYKQLKQVHKEVKELVNKGKIDSEYQKDIDIRVRNSPILALWMLGMWLYSLVLGFF